MTKTFAANFALVLVGFGAVTMVMAIAAGYVDPGPVAPMPDPRVRLRWFVAGLVIILAGSWLAGFSYSSAKIRSILALSVGCVLPVVGLWGFWW